MEIYLDLLKEKILPVVVIFFVGVLVIRLLISIFSRIKLFKMIDSTIKSFLVSLLKFILYAGLMITILSYLGVEMTTFVAILGALGLAVALALQGNMSNFASSVVILAFKPFVVGDVIEVSGEVGRVTEVQILYTHVVTLDNRKLVIPNSVLTEATLVNYTAAENRRIDLVFGASYDDDMHKVKSVLRSCVEAHDRILKDPEPVIRLSAHNESSLDYDVLVWVKKEDYLIVRYDLLEDVLQAFQENNINIPYPHRNIILDSKL